MKFGHSTSQNQEFRELPNPNIWFNLTDNQCNIYIGSTNWTEPYWKGLIYPEKTKSSEFLNYYSRFFGTIELNTTFYRNPGQEQVFKWKTNTLDDFKFCPKVPSRISQSKLLGTDTDLWHEFGSSIGCFEEKLGACFMQLPEYFDKSRIKTLETLILSPLIEYKTLFELRHESWFNDKETLGSMCSMLSLKGHGLVITDTPGRQDVLHLQICCTKLLIRFVSNGILEDDEKRISAWLKKFSSLKEKGVQEIHFIFHHPKASSLLLLAKKMMHSLKANN